jgi:protein-tyrosine phosphatase
MWDPVPRSALAIIALVTAGCLDAHGEQQTADSAVHEILVGELRNARDLGGTPLGKGATVEYGVLARGPALSRLTAAGCDEVAELGLRSVLDLREESERIATPESDCVEQQARIVHAPLPIPYSLSPTEYLADLDSDESIATAFHLLGERDAYPIYFHCTFGRDRTGVLAALILLALGASPEAIMGEYELSRASVGATPASLLAVLREVEGRGGIEAHLTTLGISDAELEVLRERARSR